ncbi:GGDEF domain-containing protein [Melaminivora sp.]|uniref:GGDEF domain-containing protein n=1 Tax=Melaminivora sp. TaxID=1933032 RepID=UPI0028B16F22|nr:GGDEF domain-containing protein [Melaminivora sp.]
MTLALDVATMLVMTAAASFAMALALATVPGERREGLGLWGLALVLHGVCYTLYALRDQISPWGSVVLANVLLSCTFATTLAAIEQFHGRPMPWWRMVLPVAAVAVLFVVYLDDFRMRVGLIGIMLPVQVTMALWGLWRRGAQVPTRGAMLLTTGLFVQIVFFSLRGWLVASGRVELDAMLQTSAIQSLSFVLTFVVVITSALGFILMTKERLEASQQHLATHDGLTDLANRRALMQVFERDLAQAVRRRQDYALLLLDIDHFKVINDTHGHPVGDRVLRHLAELLRTRVRRQDFVGRYGGEEFMVLLPGTSLAGALELAEALRRAVQATPCPHPDGAIALTVSLGVCAAYPGAEGFGGAEALIQAADRALYAAKAGGRNCVCHAPAAPGVAGLAVC